MRASLEAFVSSLAALWRLWTLRPLENASTAASEAAVISLSVASLALWVGLDRWLAGPGAQFEAWDTLTVSFYALLVLGVAFVASVASRPRLGFRSVLFALLALLPVLIIMGFLIDLRLDGRAALAARGLLALYALAYGSRALRTLSGSRQMRATAAVIMLLGGFLAYSQFEELSPSLWAPPSQEDEEGEGMPASTAEALLFDEQAQIDAAVDRMSAGTGADPEVFFVGFAGMSSQRVFAEEIKLAARVIDERFASGDRNLLLINDRRDLQTYPIATVSGLSYALNAVAQKMDPERDILFLALSSHGSADPALAVSNGSLRLEQLTADDLSTALSESGIKRRIIVISACYSGAFIESLQDPNTIVITAAAADKTSFGCSDGRDLTYFGEAFYRDALPFAVTLQQAFERAKAALAVREKQEHESASEPQAYFGSEISAVLERNPMRNRGGAYGVGNPDSTGKKGFTVAFTASTAGIR